MQHSRTLLTPAECLFQALLPWRQLQPRVRTMSQRRTAAFVNRRSVAGVDQPIITQRDRLAQFTKDENVDTATVQVKRDDGSIADPEALYQLLRSIDRKTHHVVQLSRPGERQVAVVGVFEKMELLKRLRDQEEVKRKQQRAQKHQKPKQIELNWAISLHDLELKLKQMEQFLNDGRKVEIMLATRRDKRKASPEEASELMRRIRTSIREIGAKEIKEMEGGILKHTVMTIKKGE